MKVAGVYPQFLRSTDRAGLSYEEPSGLGYVLASLEEAGHSVKLMVPVKEVTADGKVESTSKADFLNEIVKYEPDVVALSLMTPQANNGIELARKIKEINPNITIVAGGYHPSACPDIVSKENGIDVAVIGEGERTMVELMAALKRKKGLGKVKGIAFLENGKLKLTGERERIVELDSLPRPIHSEVLRKQKDISLVYPEPSKQKGFASISYSRGCPGNCRFCAEPSMYHRRVQYRSAKSMVNEIEDLIKTGVSNFTFNDTNFTANKGKVLEFCSEIMKRGIKTNFATMASINSTDEEMIDAMANAGFKKIAWGIEALSPDTLKSVNKPIKNSKTREVLKAAADRGILNTGLFMIGFENQDKNAILKEVERLKGYDLHRLRIAISTPLPGSAWHKEAVQSGEKLSTDTNLYDTEHLVYEHPSISAKEMTGIRSKALANFYHTGEYERRMKDVTRRFPHYRGTLNEYYATLPKGVRPKFRL